jgi:hypothetical protein
MAGNPLSDPNWAADVTNTIVSAVDKIRDRTTTPIVMIARGLVFGLLGSILALTAFVLFLIGMSRGLINLIEWPLDHDSAVWVSHAVLGGLLILAGSICMAKRQSKESE